MSFAGLCCRRLATLLLACALACAFATAAWATPAAPAVPSERWAAWSDTLFQHHTASQIAGGNTLAQDGSGFLWIGTQSGLVRWDGYRFRTYVADPATPGSLPDSFIAALHVDERGRLWVGTSTGGLALHDAARDRFVVHPAGPSGLSDRNVQAITDDGDGGLWLGTGAGLDHLDAAGNVRRMRGDGLPPGEVLALLLARDGTLWVGTAQGLLRRPRGVAAFSPVVLPLPSSVPPTVPQPAPAAGPPVVTRLLQDATGRIWVGTRKNGAFIVEADATQARAVLERGARPALPSDRIKAIVEARPGEVWLGTDGGGLVVVDREGVVSRRLQHRADIASSLADDDVFALLRDRSGLVWAATNTALSRHDPQQRGVLSLLGGNARPNGISHFNVSSVLQRPDGRVWLGSGDGGIDIVEPLLGRVARLQPDPDNPTGALPKGRVLAMAAGSDGEVYIGTQHGLYRSDASGRQVLRLEVPGRNATAATWALCFDAGTLWLGGTDGVSALDLHPRAPLALRRRLGAEQLGDPRVMSLLRGRGSALWIGTRSGLVRADTQSDRVVRATSDATDASHAPLGLVGSMLLDARGRLWMSSFGKGVLLLEGDGSDGPLRVRSFGRREGLPHDGVDTLLEDKKGNIWASTDDGLAVIDADTLAVRTLQRPEGVGIQTYWTNAGAVTDAGELLFGGQGGLTVVRPDLVGRWEHRPAVVVTEARVGNRPVPVGSLNRPAKSVQEIEIPPADRAFWLEFSALDYSAPERNRYAYRLEGLDADWIATDPERRLVSHGSLPPGHYTLHLRGSNRDGVWTEPALQIPIHVLPAWYQTLWFRAAAVLAAALAAFGLVGALVQARTAILRRRQHELQVLVAERTAALERRSEELRDSQRQLEQIAYTDSLTGLPNRRLFSEDLRHRVALAVRDGGPFTMLLIDLDGFKAINDNFGHDAGDAVLIATAERLKRAVREADLVARMGGDEFAVLLTQTSEREPADVICRRILHSLAEPLPFHAAALRVGASIGAALCPSQGVLPDQLCKSADLALYEAKRAGRNTWRWFEPADSAVASPRTAPESSEAQERRRAAG